jgi:hypothetical protein
VPRVIPDQKGRFESDELFRRLSRESEVRSWRSIYIGRRHWPAQILTITFFGGLTGKTPFGPSELNWL